MSLQIECLPVGALGANCYLITDPDASIGVVVDPGGDADVILAAIERAGSAISYIIDTHAHPDHIEANCELREALATLQSESPRLLVHEADRADVESPPMQWLLIGMRTAPCIVDGTLAEGETILPDSLAIRVMHVPGHSPGCIALVVGGAVFTGDTLFAGGIGRTDLPGGNERLILTSLRRLMDELPDDTLVYPGHGPTSTIGVEKATNPWLRDA